MSSVRFLIRCISNLHNKKLLETSLITYRHSVRPFHATTLNYKQKRGRAFVKQKTKLPTTVYWKDISIEEIIQNTEASYESILDAINYVEGYTNEPRRKNYKLSDLNTIPRVLKLLGFSSSLVKSPHLSEAEISRDRDAYKRPAPSPNDLVKRPPVVAIMGHVDHGKTTLLDSLRRSSIVEQEFGGITQHIGAFTVKVPSGDLVTFIDTPGHAAFSAMRARGANATDMVILVVAADDGVMEQTIESIKYANNARVPIIVAINKIDKVHKDLEPLKRSLASYGVIVEELGGDVQVVGISALKKINLDMLIESILVQAEMMEVSADPKGLMEGVILESSKDAKLGKLATVLVQRGTLTRGDFLVAGNAWAKVRTLLNDKGKELTKVTPGLAARITGWKELPSAGDIALHMESEKRAKEVFNWREDLVLKNKQKSEEEIILKKMEKHDKEYKEKLILRYQGLLPRVKGTQPNQINEEKYVGPKLGIVLKADVDGTLEAIINILATYNQHDMCKLDIIDSGVGSVLEKDIEMAKNFGGVIYAFNVGVDKLVSLDETIEIKHFNVIYHLIDDMIIELNKQLPLVDQEEVVGQATVLSEFMVNEKRKKVPIAGCKCVKGTLKKNGTLFRLERNEKVIFTGTIDSLRHHKNEVDSIKSNVECGVKLSDSNIRVENGDKLTCFHYIKVTQTLHWNPGF